MINRRRNDQKRHEERKSEQSSGWSDLHVVDFLFFVCFTTHFVRSFRFRFRFSPKVAFSFILSFCHSDEAPSPTKCGKPTVVHRRLAPCVFSFPLLF